MTTPTTASRNFPTLRYLAAPFRWLFRSRRRALTAAAVLVAMIAAPVIWWSIQLTGLPDIGDPFDVAAFRSRTMPDDRNAFVLYAEAEAKLLPRNKTFPSEGPRADMTVAWSKAAPKLREWVEANREAMELYRRAADRPDALATGRQAQDQQYEVFRSFHWLAMLEASRREEQGDMAGAWTWYRAAMRASYHFGQRGNMLRRIVADRLRTEIRTRLDAWAVDPRTTRDMLQRALDDVVACGPLATPGPDGLQQDYLNLMNELESPRNYSRYFRIQGLLARMGGRLVLAPEHLRAIGDVWRFWRGEPERSRRVLRLAFANWLAYYALPPDRRPAPDPDASGPVRFYSFGPEAPAAARALSPRAIRRWYDSTTDAQGMFLMFNPTTLYTQETRNYRALIVSLGCELYHRDRGKVPLRDEDLVGPYLKELPDAGLDDGSGRPGGETRGR